jgi:tight adherence protein B
MHELVAPYRDSHSINLHAFKEAVPQEKSLAEMAASVFGFSLARLDHYPVRWWIVLGGTFVVARIGAGFAVDVVGSIGLLGMPVLWVGLCRLFFGWFVAKRQALLILQFPDALASIVRSVRVGIPVLGAITAVGREAQAPTSLEFTRLANELAVGVPLYEAVKDMGARNRLSEYRFFATAIGLQAQTGGALSETLENLADLIRKRTALRERGHALSSEARTSSLILGALPVVLGLGLWLVNPAYMSVLFTTSMGRTIVGCAVLSLCCAGVTMRVIIKKSLS